MNRAVFLDRDGTLIEERGYLRSPEEVQLLPGVAEALRRLQDAGFLLFLITNQSGIGRGYFTAEDVVAVHQRLQELLAQNGVSLTSIYVAPEAPDQPSRGRKPSPQFLWDARDTYQLDLSASYMVGDKMIDLECGWNAGVSASILVRTGYGADVERNAGASRMQAMLVDNLAAAADWILSRADAGTVR